MNFIGDSMNCPRCGKLLMKDCHHTFCPHCGYLDDGEQIHGYEEHQASDLEIYLGKDFDKIWRNENWFTSFILGPLYLCYRGFILLGLILMPLEWLFWDVMFHSFSRFRYYLLGIAVLISRLLFSAVNNMICIYFYNRQIKKIKKKHPDTYLEELRKRNGHFNKYMSLVLAVLLFILFVISLILIYINLLKLTD